MKKIKFKKKEMKFLLSFLNVLIVSEKNSPVSNKAN